MLWIFAYGSLIFRPGFPFVERRRALADGYARRFHQGSADHRGTPAHLGRVVTLVPTPGARCEGLAYRVETEHRDSVLTELDEREQGGYERAAIRVRYYEAALSHSVSHSVDATTWIAHAGNPYWLGDAPHDALVARIRAAHGPSGANTDYVLRLRAALRELSITDEHVEAVADALQDHDA